MKVLFIEDDMIESMKLQRAVAKFDSKHDIIEAKNGEEALDILQNGDLPDIILLDLNMPRMSGIEFLQVVKADDKLRYLPTVILTTSENRVDLLRCFQLGIAGYIIKPLKYEDYEKKIKRVFEYWEVSELIKG
ncbi:Response regulator receiver domain-containing protein [Croceitalea dokdonensis DOKDO 023]|uniref:Response regulator receiver domain-containing protein n=1 Tax=Croceitalea dokdonensis DOKDO 023 TaxID=1300341 RepID=A0A0N8H3P9_9FLAO|nr:response regulator [Croceitalea dokdonensis]KPM31180.1 Response regulator receiver domain-containing protein [Croceitalea dokdonensis DOKDO 023]